VTTISAQTILSSQHAYQPHRLTGMMLHYPRWIHAEQRTHRVISLEEALEFLEATPSVMADPNLSRNAASSRAIPVAKMIADIEADPAVPIFWGKNVAGMQANEELPPHLIVIARDNWLYALENAIKVAKMMANLAPDEDGPVVGAHKQIINRLLEPFMHIRVFVSATEWDNFLELRDHEAAEPHIQVLARAVREELAKPAMQVLLPGEHHLPWIKSADRAEAAYSIASADTIGYLRKLSTARCASTSYLTVDQKEMSPFAACELHDKLVSARPIHASPTEHIAEADEFSKLPGGGWRGQKAHRNFVGFKQYRAIVEGLAR
jgi:hypothetical protein